MRKIVLILSAVLVMAACRDESAEVIRPHVNEITLSSDDDVVVGTLQGEPVDFTVTPSGASFIYDVSRKDCQIGLKYAPDSPEAGETPLLFFLGDVVHVKDDTYQAVLFDAGSDMDYDESVVLSIALEDGLQIQSLPFRVRRDKGPYFNEFCFLKEHNPTAVYEDIRLDVSSFEAQFASPLVSSPNLVASFDCPDAKVYVGGVEQVSGETVNDYSEPVMFTVKGKSEYNFTIQISYSGLPVVFVETGGRAIPSKWEDWLEDAHVKIYNADWSVDLDASTSIRGRGNSTWGYPKKPYALKLDSGAEVLGMPKHKRWVLLANWMDRTLLRNDVSFKLASMTSLAYTPRGEFVELYINGKHNGNYYLCEHIKVDENRVNIDELDEGEVDGGYILELDSYYDEVNRFKSEIRGLPYMFKDPDEVNAQQFAYIQEYVNNMERSLYDDSRFATGEYKEYIDSQSFADWWLVMELTGIWEPNHPKSTYMYKDKGGRLTMGPVWDFDWETYMNTCWFRIKDALYYERLFQDPAFVSLVKERWNCLEPEFRSLPDYIRTSAEHIRASETMNHAMWPITQTVNNDEKLTFDQAVERMIESYQKKLEWMDKQL